MKITKSQQQAMEDNQIDLKAFLKTYTEGAELIEGVTWKKNKYMIGRNLIVEVTPLVGYRKTKTWNFGPNGKVTIS